MGVGVGPRGSGVRIDVDVEAGASQRVLDILLIGGRRVV